MNHGSIYPKTCSQCVRRRCASGTRACFANADRQHLFDACALQSSLDRSISSIAVELNAPFQQQRRFREGRAGRAWDTGTSSCDGQAQKSNSKPRCRTIYRASARRCEFNDKIAAGPGKPISSQKGAERASWITRSPNPMDNRAPIVRLLLLPLRPCWCSPAAWPLSAICVPGHGE